MGTNRPGRPTIGDTPRDKYIRLRVTEQEYCIIHAAAHGAGMTVSAYIAKLLHLPRPFDEYNPIDSE